jgi:hypothetical protein
MHNGAEKKSGKKEKGTSAPEKKSGYTYCYCN